MAFDGPAEKGFSRLTMTADFTFDPATGEILDPPRANTLELSVSELSAALKRTLEDAYGYVRVRGEVSKVSRPASGHCYFDLKDDAASIAAVVFKGGLARLRHKPEQGMEVVVTGRITTFAGQSRYQIIVETLEPAGQGALMAMLEDRRRKLAAEGLFDTARKRPLPMLPRVIAVVTSPTGAVIRDILHRLADRFPRHVLVWPVRVQGETCAAEVAAAIEGLNAISPGGTLPRPDIIIVARGGGSLEDLWGFNEEAVVRAAAASAIPLISAIGHETDTTLIDLAADLRAPTPTAAAEHAVPVRADLLSQLASLDARQRQAAARRLAEARLRLRAAKLPRAEDAAAAARQRFDVAAGRLTQALLANLRIHRGDFQRVAARLNPQALRLANARRRDTLERLAADQRYFIADGVRRRREQLEGQGKLLQSLSYREILKRGFALVRAQGTGEPLHAAGDTHPSQAVAIEFHDGCVAARIEGPTAVPRGKRRGGTSSTDQGSLF
jgi:exodeoxyribonuclease VII large subunit